MDYIPNEKFEGARIFLRNFSGREIKKNGRILNKTGDRNFGLVISDPDRAADMKRLGWNVKEFEPKEDGEQPTYFIKVTVKFGYKPPKVWLHTKRSRARLDEDSIDSLDDADIVGCDLVITPYNWSVNGSEGISAYLKTMHVLIEEDEFGDKWAEEESPDYDLPYV